MKTRLLTGSKEVDQGTPEECTTPYTQARRPMQEKYLAEIADRFSVPILQIPLLPHEVKGLTVLESLGDRVLGAKGND